MMPFIIGNSHFVCLKCRRSIKVWSRDSILREEIIPCATCGAAMLCVGKKFTTPRKRDNAAWKKLEWMIQNGWRGYGWPTPPKMNLSQTQELIAVAKRQSANQAQARLQDESLREQRRSVKHNAAHSKAAKRRHKAELKQQEEYQTAVLEAVASNSASSAPTSPTP